MTTKEIEPKVCILECQYCYAHYPTDIQLGRNVQQFGNQIISNCPICGTTVKMGGFLFDHELHPTAPLYGELSEPPLKLKRI